MWELRIGGMRCQGCAESVRTALARQASSEAKDVNLESGRVLVEGATLDAEQLARDLAGAGLELLEARPWEGAMPSDEAPTPPAAPGLPPSEPVPPPPAVPASEELLEIAITGMTCVQCAAGIERALRALPQVEEARVSFAASAGLVRVNADSEAPREALLEQVRRAGYGAEWAGAEQDRQHLQGEWRAFQQACVLAAVALSVLLIPEFRERPGLRLVLATLTLLGPGRSFLRNAWRSLASRRPGMDLLVALGACLAWSGSLAVVSGWLPVSADHGLAAVWLVFFLRGGRLLEARARRRVSATLRGLIEALPARALRERNGVREEIDAEQLVAGDLVRVGPAQRFPADGVVREGHSATDESALSGESLPVDKVPGSPVSAGTLNQQGLLLVEVTQAGGASKLGQLAHLLRASLLERAPVTRLTDRVAAVFVPLVLLLGTLAFLMAWSRVGVAGAWVHGLATLLIACPCALSLATPVALLAGTQRALSQGVLCKSLASLEMLATVDVVMLDKTGTLTAGHPEVVRHGFSDGWAEAAPSVAYLASVSRHPVAQAVGRALAAAGMKPVAGQHKGMVVEEVAGAGMRGRPCGEGREVRLGSTGFTGAPPPLAEQVTGTLVTATVGGRWVGWWEVEDPLRPQAAQAVADLKERDLDVVLVSGDRAAVAESVAATLGIGEVHADCTPLRKVEILEQRQAAGHRVLFAGDGFNDGGALARAEVGVAWGSGTDLARDAGSIVLLRGGPGDLVRAWDVSRSTRRVVHQNLAFAMGYNLLAVPWAMGLFAGAGMPTLPPWVAALAMSASSLSVVLNALRLAPPRVDSTGPSLLS